MSRDEGSMQLLFGITSAGNQQFQHKKQRKEEDKKERVGQMI